MTSTPWRRFVGQNIKGNPSMTQHQVWHDLKVVKSRADVAVIQEFKWTWYWRALAAAMPLRAKNKWRSFPRRTRGMGSPVVSGQPILWRGTIYKRIDSISMLLHRGAAKISETRYLRAVLLRDRAADGELCAWFGTTHFVVGGDGGGDGPIRKFMLFQDMDKLEDLLTKVVASGWPVIFELDANIHRGTEAYGHLLWLVRSHGGRFYGGMGVEYLFVIDGRRATVEVSEHWEVPTSALYTDHEGRGITFRLVAA